jgi:hypothetical protein
MSKRQGDHLRIAINEALLIILLSDRLSTFKEVLLLVISLAFYKEFLSAVTRSTDTKKDHPVETLCYSFAWTMPFNDS